MGVIGLTAAGGADGNVGDTRVGGDVEGVGVGGGCTTRGITDVDELGEAETPLGSVAVAVAVFDRVPRATSAALVM
jgi:hypothetical protein